MRQYATGRVPCATPVATPGRAVLGSAALLADAEPAEDHAEQVVGTELAGDAGELVLRQPQFLGKQVQHCVAPRRVPGRILQMERACASACR